MDPTNRNDPDHRLGKGMIFAAWIVFLVMLTFFFQQWIDTRNNPNKKVISQINQDGVREIVLKRNPFGHYVATGSINGYAVEFLLDTGATDVALSARLADRLGLNYGYAGRSVTAAGTVTSYHTVLNQVALGNVIQSDVQASILPKMTDNTVLLGMSFLRNLEIIQKGDILTIRQHAD